MKFLMKYSILILIVSSVTFLATSCTPPIGGGTPTPVVSDSLAVGRYLQTNVINTPMPTIIRGGTVEIYADHTVYIQLLQTFPLFQFPAFYDFIGTYTKSGNTINFTVVYSGGLTIPNPSRIITGTLSLITNVTPNKVSLKFNTLIPLTPTYNEDFIFEK